MWAEPGNGLNMKVLWTDTPYAMQRVAGMFEAGQITTAERDDLTHFIDHGWLIKFIEHRIADRRVLRLIQKWLKAGVMEQGKRMSTEVGSPQGATVSPLLANIWSCIRTKLGFFSSGGSPPLSGRKRANPVHRRPSTSSG